jgi:hypothetical protein
MRSRTIAVAGSIAALSLAAVPIAQAASTPDHPTTVTTSVDRPHDRSIDRHTDRSRDVRSPDTSRDFHDW